MAVTNYPGWTDWAVGDNRWHAPSVRSVGNSASHNAVTSSACAFPFVPPIDMTIDSMGIFSGGSSGDAGATDMVIRAGAYNANQTTMYPSSLIFDTGNMTVNTTGIQKVDAGTPFTLTAGTLYYLVVKKQNTPSNAAQSVANIAVANGVMHSPYQNATTVTDSVHYPLVGALANGAFADPYTAGAAPTFIADYPIPWFRLSAIG